jgi:hypothetical protein
MTFEEYVRKCAGELRSAVAAEGEVRLPDMPGASLESPGADLAALADYVRSASQGRRALYGSQGPGAGVSLFMGDASDSVAPGIAIDFKVMEHFPDRAAVVVSFMDLYTLSTMHVRCYRDRHHILSVKGMCGVSAAPSDEEAEEIANIFRRWVELRDIRLPPSSWGGRFKDISHRVERV